MTNEEIRDEGGNVKSENKLTCFLYMLIRDVIPAGEIEKIVNQIENEHDQFVFTNGWIANYAKNLTKRLSEL